MHVNITYDENFTELMLFLKAKYGQKLFDLDGIGSQLDIDQFSKGFFSNAAPTADISVDANSNISTKDMIVYNAELPKPYFRLNAYYLVWRKLKQLYGQVEANRIIEMQLSGDFYINDFHGVSQPYSYHPQTTITIRVDGCVKSITMVDLFEELSFFINSDVGSGYIDTSNLNIEILDKGKWVKLLRLLRHRSHSDLVRIETKRGGVCVVTEDHPVILSGGDEKIADEVTFEDELMHQDRYAFSGTKEIDLDEAYIIGAMVGDGYVCRGKCVLVQNDIVNTHYYELINKKYDHVNEEKENRLNFGTVDTAELYKKLIGLGAINKHLPRDWPTWSEDARLSLLAGVIDTDGTVNKRNGVVDVRLISLAAIQQIAELVSTLGFDRIRTSLVNKYKSKKSYKSNYKLYRVSFRVNNKKLSEFSRKVREMSDVVFRVAGIDGRWDSDRVNKIDLIDWKGEWVYDVTTETGTFYSNGLTVHNCYNYSTFDVALNGLTMVNKITSIPPKYLYSFKSQLEQFVVIASNSTLGATGLADLFIVIGYYVDKILETSSDAGFRFQSEEDCWRYVKENIVSFIYTINQPMRVTQSPFTNVSVFDNGFLETLVPEYVFPDGKAPNIGTVKKLQYLFLDTMNEELKRTPITFPVVTACFSVDEEGAISDDEFLGGVAERNLEYGFINLYCGKTSTLSSCCRLRSDTNNEYFNSFGSGSTKIGSLGVVTINLPRLAYRFINDKEAFLKELELFVEIAGKINNSKRKIIQKRIANGAQPLYSLGFMDINKQYSTCGLNGINEAIEILGMNIVEDEGSAFAIEMFQTINRANDRLQRQYKAPHNCEQTPSENSSIKLAKKDDMLGYKTGAEFYSNQFIPLITEADMLDRIKLQGMFDKHFSGGAICHINIEGRIEEKEVMVDLIRACAERGVIYFAVNYNLQKCINDHMSVGKSSVCPICGSEGLEDYTRVVGFLTAVKNWHHIRRELDYPKRVWYCGPSEASK